MSVKEDAEGGMGVEEEANTCRRRELEEEKRGVSRVK